MDSFVIDTNIIFSSLLKNSTTRKIILSDTFNLFAPEYLFTEIKKYEKEILKKTELKIEDLSLLLLLLQSHIAMVPIASFSRFLKEGEEVMKNIDIKDATFLALALKMKIPIWSNDLHFKQQNRVLTYTTEEIITTFIKNTT